MASAGSVRAGRAYVEIFVSGLRKAESDLSKFAGSLKGIGQKFTALGALAAVPFALAAKTSAGFEQNMARVKAITNASEGDFAKLGDTAKKLGRDTVFSAADAARAMGNFAQAGFKVNEIMAATGPTLDLAAAAQIDVSEAAAIAAKVMRGMGIAAADLGTVVDVMAKAATTGNTDIVQLGDAFRFVGPIAKTAGVSLAEITAAIQLLSNAGIQGEMAGTTLRGMILSLTAPSQEAADELERLHIKVNDVATGNFRGLVAIVGDLNKELSRMGSGKKLESLGKIFPARSAAGAAVLAAEGAEKLAAATAAIGDSSGTASRIAKTQLDTLFGSFKLFESSVEGLGIELGSALTPAIRAVGDVLIGVTNGLAIWVKENRAAIVAAGKLAAAVIGVGAALYAAGLAAKALAVTIGVVRTVVAVTTAVVYGINAAFRLLAITINLASVATTVFSGLSAILAAMVSPVGLLVIGLAALAGWLVYTGNAGKLLDGLGQAFQTLKADATAAFGGISEALKAGDLAKAGKIVVALFRLEWVRLSAWLQTLWADWGGILQDAFGIASARIATFFVDAWTTIQTAGITAFGILQDAWAGVVAGMKVVWIGLVAEVQKQFATLRHGLNAAAAGREKLGIDQQAQADMRAAVVEGQNLPGKQDRVGQLAAVGAVGDAQKQAIADQQAAGAEARRRAVADGLAAGAAALKTAEDDLANLLKPAAGAAGAGKPGGIQVGGEAAQALGPDLGKRLGRANVEATSTFSAAAVAGLGVGGGLAQRQLDETKEQTKELRKIRQEAKDRDELS